MKILLDTHIFLWFIAGDPKVDDHSRELIENLDNGRHLSIASIWEITIKSSLGRLDVPLPISSLVRDHVWANAIETRQPTILRNEPIIRGTRTPVRAIVEHWKFGDTPETIVRKLPYLRLAQVFDALSYYDDHRAEIEQYIAANRVPVDD